ncbi:hypothetical protein GS504_01455 [Rhodococcus hoagii]|nr:hypothetical protein [Prescottella equi]NKS71660.1 hypothetical protein [Prescottella equi]
MPAESEKAHASALRPLPRAYRLDWARFSDWATAFARTALPAHPVTLALYLDTNPAARATHRRWVTSVNAVHRAHGLDEPGRADRVRMLLRPHLFHGTDERRSGALELVRTIPVSGWPQGFFGRRDALIVMLATYAGLSYTELRELDRGMVRGRADGLYIAGRDPLPSPTHCDPAWTPSAVWARWAHLQSVADRYPGTRSMVSAMSRGLLDVRFDDGHFPAVPEVDSRQDGPLFRPIDRWGHTPFGRARLSAQAIGQIVRSHLNGTAPAHSTSLPRAWDPGYRPTPTAPPPPPPVEAPRGPVLDYDTAIARRREGLAELAEASSALDEVNDKADELMQRLLELLEHVGEG